MLTYIMINEGLLELREGDWLLARDVHGDGDPESDIIQVFVLGRCVPWHLIGKTVPLLTFC